MTEIYKARSFPASSARCMAGLLRIWPFLDIRVRRSNPAEGTAEGSWQSGSGAAFIFRAECKKTGENACEVVLRHDLQWTSIWSRPVVANETVSKKLNERTLEQVDRIFSTLGEYLQDETKFTKGTPPASLTLDHLAWAIGAVVSIGARLSVGAIQRDLNPALGQSGAFPLLRLMGLAGVLVGGLVAGFLKRRAPARGSAFFEGLIVAIVNIWLSLVVYSSAFAMGTIDWIVYGVVGVAAASLVSIRFPAKRGD
jgi:hypothetical protein